MKSNKVIVFGVIAAIVFVSLITTLSSTKKEKVGETQHSTTNEPEKVESLVGDTTADNYKSLQLQLLETEKKYQESLKVNEKINSQYKTTKKQVETLTKRFENFIGEKPVNKTTTRRIINKIDNGKDTEDESKNNEIDPKNKFIDKIKSIRESTNLNSDEFHLQKPFGVGGTIIQQNPSENQVTTENKNRKSGWLMPIEQEGNINKKVQKIIAKEKKKTPIESFPAMTISDNAVLYDVKTLTYLVGRIPVGGRVSDPYPVKLLIGNDNLMANGYDLPGIEGMFFSGYATGDMNMNCVRAEMNSYTFIFNDGRQVTHRQKPRTGKASEEPMAYISDRWGLPCVVGTFVSNVAEFIGIQAGLSALSAAGEAYAAAQTTTTSGTSLTGSTSSVTGSQGKYAMGKVVDGAVGDISKWFLERQENSFDAVVVKSNADVSLHLNVNINVDYKKAARKIDYDLDFRQVNLLD